MEECKLFIPGGNGLISKDLKDILWKNGLLFILKVKEFMFGILMGKIYRYVSNGNRNMCFRLRK